MLASPSNKPLLTEKVISEKIDLMMDFLLQTELFVIDLVPSGEKRINFRRQILVHLFALSVNTSHGISELLVSRNVFASGILVRSILEQWTNMQYIYLTSSYENLVRYLYDGDTAFIKNATQLAGLFKAVNEHGDFDDLINDAQLGAGYRVSSSNDLKKYKYPLKNMPPYIDRVRMIDEYNESMDMITDYYWSYAQFSTNVHTTKDKIIEMSYAQTYEEWFQATSEGSLVYTAASIINTTVYTIENIVHFVARKHRMKIPKNLMALMNDGSYKINFTEFDYKS